MSAMLAGVFSPCFRRTQENLWGLPVTSGQPSGRNDARASLRPLSIARSIRKTSAANFAQTALCEVQRSTGPTSMSIPAC
jgi:hypothetical protein